MPRDYAKNSRSRASARSGPSGMVWLLMGVLLGMIIAGVFYLKNQHLTLPNPTAIPEVKKATPSTATTPSNNATTTQASPQNLQTQFDFYNVLPSQKVIGPSGDEDTTAIQNQNNAITNQTPNSNMQTANTSENANPAVNNNTQTANTQQSTTEAATPPATTSAPAPAQPQHLAPVTAAPPTVINPPSESSKTKTPPPSAPSTKPSSYILQIATFSQFTDADQLKAQLTLAGFEVNISPVQKNGQTLQRVWLGPFHSQDAAQSAQQQLQQNQINSKLLKSD